MAGVINFIKRPLILNRLLPLRSPKAAAGAYKPKFSRKAKAVDKDTGPVEPIKYDPAVCNGANYLVGGEDPPLKPDADYPDWLWTLLEPRTDTGVDSQYYWRKLKKDAIIKANKKSKKK